MSNYENEVKEYIKELDAVTQKRAVVAIQDAQKEGRDWLWVSTALKKKSTHEWQKWGFGLFFDQKFQASVYQQIERDKRCKSINLDSWLAGGSFENLTRDSVSSVSSHTNTQNNTEPLVAPKVRKTKDYPYPTDANGNYVF